MTRKQQQLVDQIRENFGHCLVHEVVCGGRVDVHVVYDYNQFGTEKHPHRQDPQLTVISPAGRLHSTRVSYKSKIYHEWRESLVETE